MALSQVLTEDKHHVRRASVSIEATLALGGVVVAMVGTSLLNRTLACTLPAMECKVIHRQLK